MQPTTPPPGAVVLFDGKNLDGWVSASDKAKARRWKLLDSGVDAGPAAATSITKEKFDGNFKLHVEFRVPYMPKTKGQGRGNSGVYVQGRYEVQVLDSYGLKSKDNDCGAIYEVAAPLVNACKAPTVWQSYDIEFTAPKCEDGKKTCRAAHHRLPERRQDSRQRDDHQWTTRRPASAATPARRARSCSRTTATRCSSATSG